MNKRRLMGLLRKQRPEPPVGFEARIDSQLDRLLKGEQVMKSKRRVSVALIAAVLLVLLAGTALAWGYSNLMEYLHHRNIKPLDGTEELIQTEFGAQPTEAGRSGDKLPEELVAYVVEEALYDGQTVIVQLLVTPTHPEDHAILHTGIQEISEGTYSGIVRHADGSTDIGNITRKDGKRIIGYTLDLRQADADAGYRFERGTLEALELDDGTIRVWLEGSIVEGSTDVVELIVHCGYGFYDQMSGAGWVGYPYHDEKQIRLETSTQTRSAILTPVGDTKGERFEILGAFLTFNPIQGQITIEYSYLPDGQNEPMGIAFRAYDAGNHLIELGDSVSSTLLERREDGTEVYRLVQQIQAFDAFPEKVYLEAKVIDKEQALGKLEFQVREATAEEMNGPETTPGAIAGKKPVGLVMKPVESWSGEYICLLEGSVHSDRSVELSYTYSGEQSDGERIVVYYKDASGNAVGAVLTSSLDRKEGTIIRTDTLDGSGWPFRMLVEFELDGVILNVFTVELHSIFDAAGEP